MSFGEKQEKLLGAMAGKAAPMPGKFMSRLDFSTIFMYNGSIYTIGGWDMEKRNTILIACPEAKMRELLRLALEEHFNLLEATSLPQALVLLQQHRECVTAVAAASQIIRGAERNITEGPLGQAPIIVITADGSENPAPFFRYGASDVIPVDYDAYAMLRRIEAIVQLHLSRQHLQTVVREQEEKMRRANDDLVSILSSLIEYRSVESGKHILRIRCFTRILMEEVMRHCPEYGLTDRLVTIISSASALHDIGKIAIPDAIFTKPGPLTEEEWAVMKTHSVTGCQILDTLGTMADQEYLRYAWNICRYHHERWDGKGYPDGLLGDQIPVCAQVVGLADAYDALTSQRVYKDALPFDQAVNMILKGQCGAFSPKLMECFKNVTAQFKTLSEEYADGRDPEDTPFDLSLPAPTEDTGGSALDRTRAMYFSLVHYVGGFLMEVNLDRKIFHVIYNPYPEMVQIQDINTLSQLTALMLDKIVAPQEREEMAQLIRIGIPSFVEEDLRRVSYRFHFQPQPGMPGGPFEMTLLRSGSTSRRSLAILLRMLPREDSAIPGLETAYPLRECTYVCANDPHFTLIALGREGNLLAGYTAAQLREQFGGHLDALIHPEDRVMVRQEFTRQLRTSTLVRLEHRVVQKDGRVLWVTNHSRMELGANGQELLYSFLTNVSPTQNLAGPLRDKLERYEAILSQAGNVLFDWDLEKDTIEFSQAWQKTFGILPPQQNAGEWICQGAHIHPDDLPLLMDRLSALNAGSDQESVDIRIASAQGRYLWSRIRAAASRGSSGKMETISGLILNIEEEKQKARALMDQADRDSLTKLWNKAAARRQIESYLAHYPRGVNCAMLIIDLDNFKQVNDQYGHLFGDAVLTEVAREIRRQFRSQDIQCRIGGDEFLVLVRGLSDRHLLENRCHQFLGALGADLRSKYPELKLGCSIGISLCPHHGTTYIDLFNRADQALYQAKAAGKNDFRFYEPLKEAFSPAFGQTSAVSGRIDSDEGPSLAEDNIVRTAFQLLYTAKDVEAAVQEVMAFLGTQTNVSRVYVFENSEDNLYCSNTFEWCNSGIQPEIQNLQNISYLRDIPDFEANFNEQGVFYCPDISVLPQPTYDIVAAQGIHSMLQCAIRQGGVFRGYIGFDECVRQRLWSKEEIRMLAYFSDILSLFLLKHREQEKMRIQAEDLRTILENQSVWTYIINPDSWELEYLNGKARQGIPNAREGLVCYRALLGREGPCPDCPALGIREKGTARSILWDQRYQENILAEATMIHWHGQESCLMTCRKMPEV